MHVRVIALSFIVAAGIQASGNGDSAALTSEKSYEQVEGEVTSWLPHKLFIARITKLSPDHHKSLLDKAYEMRNRMVINHLEGQGPRHAWHHAPVCEAVKSPFTFVWKHKTATALIMLAFIIGMGPTPTCTAEHYLMQGVKCTDKRPHVIWINAATNKVALLYDGKKPSDSFWQNSAKSS